MSEPELPPTATHLKKLTDRSFQRGDEKVWVDRDEAVVRVVCHNQPELVQAILRTYGEALEKDNPIKIHETILGTETVIAIDPAREGVANPSTKYGSKKSAPHAAQTTWRRAKNDIMDELTKIIEAHGFEQVPPNLNSTAHISEALQKRALGEAKAAFEQLKTSRDPMYYDKVRSYLKTAGKTIGDLDPSRSPEDVAKELKAAHAEALKKTQGWGQTISGLGRS